MLLLLFVILSSYLLSVLLFWCFNGGRKHSREREKEKMYWLVESLCVLIQLACIVKGNHQRNILSLDFQNQRKVRKFVWSSLVISTCCKGRPPLKRGTQSGQGDLLFSWLKIVEYQSHKFCVFGRWTIFNFNYEWRPAFKVVEE